MFNRRDFMALAGSLALADAATAQGDFPNRPIKVVVPFTPGGSNDLIGRVVATKLAEKLGWATVVDNRPGAGGAIGAQAVATSPADGHTLLSVSTTHTVAAVVQKLPYHPITSFTPIALLGTAPSVVLVTPSLPVNSIAELIALAKASPGKLSYSSAGTGTISHLIGELFNTTAKTNIVHVPYKGGTPAMNDLIAGHIQVYHGGLAAVLPLIRMGKMKALGVTSLKRAEAAPDIPAVAETLPGFDANIWYGIFGAAGTPQALATKLNAEISAIMRDPEVVKKLSADAIQPATMSQPAFTKFVADDLLKWTEVGRAAGLKPE